MINNKLKEFSMFKKCYLGIGLFFLFLLTSCFGPGSVTVTIQPDGNQMAYLTKEFKVKAGQQVTLIMDNIATVPVMKHNVLILTDETKLDEVGRLAITAPGNIPQHPAILASTPMADAGAQTQVNFKAPTTPGKYVYICTYPGHYAMMQGVMIVE